MEAHHKDKKSLTAKETQYNWLNHCGKNPKEAVRRTTSPDRTLPTGALTTTSHN